MTQISIIRESDGKVMRKIMVKGTTYDIISSNAYDNMRMLGYSLNDYDFRFLFD